MDQPLTYGEFLEEMRKQRTIDLSENPARHPVAFALVVIIVFAILTLLADVLEDVFQKYLGKSSQVKKIALILVGALLVYYIIKQYKFSAVNFAYLA